MIRLTLIWRAVILAVVVGAQVNSVPLQVLAQSGFALAPLVKRGDPSPDGGRFFGCDDCEGRINGSHAFNNTADVGLAADTEGACFDGRFLVAGGRAELLADFCRDTPWGKFRLMGLVNINDQAQASLIAGPLIGDRIVTMVFLYSDGHLSKIAAEGERAPTGATFKCFAEPSINNRGQVAFGACAQDDQRLLRDGVFLYDSGEIRKVVTSGERSPIGGVLALNFIPAVTGLLNNNGEVLFHAAVVPDQVARENYGLFVAGPDGIRKVVVDGDPLTDGLMVRPATLGIGDLNDNGQVAFTVALEGSSDTGIFINSSGSITKIMAQGDPTPVGGTFATLEDPDLIERFLFIRPRINDNGAVAFIAKVNNGSSPLGIFLGSPKAMLKVVAVGDEIPTGETIKEIDTFALNDLGQVAFFAYGKKGKQNPLGVYVATPVTPKIKKIKVKRSNGVLELRVTGKAMITNDTVIEINGAALQDLDYPSDFREDGGTITRVISRDPRLEQLLAAGQTVQVTLFNSLTNKGSEPFALSR